MVTPVREPVAYVVGAGVVVPVSLAANRPGEPIHLPGTGAIAITPDGGTLYVASWKTNAVTPIDTVTGRPGKPIGVGVHPAAMTVTPDGNTLYVASLGGQGPHPPEGRHAPGTRLRITPKGPRYPSSVTAISTATSAVIKSIDTGHRPRAIAVTPDSKTAYVINQGSSTMTPVDTATNMAAEPIQLGYSPLAMAITPDGSTIYTANPGEGERATVTAISTATNTVINTITGCPGAGLTDGSPVIAVTPDSKTAYVICNRPVNAGTVLPISVATNTPGDPISVGPAPQAIVVTPDSKTAYVGCYSGTVLPIDIATGTTGQPIAVGDGVRRIAITSDGKTAYVVSASPGTVTPISAATHTAGEPIQVGRGAFAIAIRP